MRRIRFHIGTLLAIVLILGIAFAALRESNDMWDSSVFTLTAAVLLTAVLLAIHRIESKRAFWLGFALFGATYLGISLVASVEPRLVTTKVLAFIDSKLPRSMPIRLAYADFDNDGDVDLFVANNSQPSVLYGNNGSGTFHYAGNGTLVINNPARVGLVGTSESFMRIGHSLIALIVAVLGGLFSRYLQSKNLGRTPW